LSFQGVFKGHELTRKDRRLTCGISQIDALIGGIARGRISEITGPERCAQDLKRRHARV
jgi:RecA/RadA recombinase